MNPFRTDESKALEDSISRIVDVVMGLQKMTRFHSIILQDLIDALRNAGIPPVGDPARLKLIEDLADEISKDQVVNTNAGCTEDKKSET